MWPLVNLIEPLTELLSYCLVCKSACFQKMIVDLCLYVVSLDFVFDEHIYICFFDKLVIYSLISISILLYMRPLHNSL